MKQIFFLLALVSSVMLVKAQTMDTVFVYQKPRSFKAREHILIMYETVNVIEPTGNGITLSRSYYFDKKNLIIEISPWQIRR